MHENPTCDFEQQSLKMPLMMLVSGTLPFARLLSIPSAVMSKPRTIADIPFESDEGSPVPTDWRTRANQRVD